MTTSLFRTQRNDAWARFGRSVCSQSPAPSPHLRSVSPVTRPIITSSCNHTEAGQGWQHVLVIQTLVSTLFCMSRGVYNDGSARFLGMTATRRSPSMLRCAPHVLRRKAVPLPMLPVPIGQSQQLTSPPGETYASVRPPPTRFLTFGSGSSGAESPQVHAVPS